MDPTVTDLLHIAQSGKEVVWPLILLYFVYKAERRVSRIEFLLELALIRAGINVPRASRARVEDEAEKPI